METIEWTSGLYNYQKCRLETSGIINNFTTELTDNDFELDRNIADIFEDHLRNRQTTKVEVLYSGGLDSELVLLACIRKNIPVIAMTLVILIDGMIINTHDLYYAEKFCRQNNIEHKLFYLNANEFYDSGKYLDYVIPYKIIEPHVATHFWLIEQCNYFPIIGGDWPWVHAHRSDKILSPFRLEFSSYERFMRDKGIYGIGNMISYSLESSCKMIKLHIENYKDNQNVALLKHKMYSDLEPNLEPRLRSYGWELARIGTFFLSPKKVELIKKVYPTKPVIKWGNKIAELINSSTYENSLFN